MNPNPVQIYDFPDEICPPPPQPPPQPPRMRLSRTWRIWLAVVAVLTVMGVGGAATRIHTVPGAATANPTAVAKYRERVKADEELKRQADQKAATQAVKTTCDAILSTFVPPGNDAISKLNAYTVAFNTGDDPNSLAGPAVSALNNLADLIVHSFGNGVGAAQPAYDHQLFQDLADALRSTAATVSGPASPDDFNSKVDKLNDARGKTIRPCVAVEPPR